MTVLTMCLNLSEMDVSSSVSMCSAFGRCCNKDSFNSCRLDMLRSSLGEMNSSETICNANTPISDVSGFWRS